MLTCTHVLKATLTLLRPCSPHRRPVCRHSATGSTSRVDGVYGSRHVLDRCFRHRLLGAEAHGFLNEITGRATNEAVLPIPPEDKASATMGYHLEARECHPWTYSCNRRREALLSQDELNELGQPAGHRSCHRA